MKMKVAKNFEHLTRLWDKSLQTWEATELIDALVCWVKTFVWDSYIVFIIGSNDIVKYWI